MTVTLYTETEVREMLRVKDKTLRKIRAEGQIAFVMVGHNIRYTPEAVQTFIEANTHTNAPHSPTVRVKAARRGRRDNGQRGLSDMLAARGAKT